MPFILAFHNPEPQLEFNEAILTVLDVLMVFVYVWSIAGGFCTGMVARYGLRRAVVYDWGWVARK